MIHEQAIMFLRNGGGKYSFLVHHLEELLRQNNIELGIKPAKSIPPWKTQAVE